ncbi:hypothetical protein FRB90_000085 [Tulasnella sp. 427]|nr:hypothetical protein FRB90_000085 [Tulasnella sp. 427]
MKDAFCSESGESREAHAILYLQEVLAQIFLNLEKWDLATAARVCRAWTDVALDLLWEHLEAVRPIMALLGTDWENSPSGDWSRFQSYIKRIRSLSYFTKRQTQDDAIITERIAIPALAELLRYTAVNGGQYLLPRLRKIDWSWDHDDQLRMIMLFISPQIKDIKLVPMAFVTPEGIVRALRSLGGVLHSGLRSFYIEPQQVSFGDGDSSTAIRRLLEKQDDLQELRVPFLPMNPFMFKPKLEVLDIQCPFESTIEIERLLSQLVQSCPLLINLQILLYAETNLDPTIDFQTIRPLLQCTRLQTLEVEWRGNFELNSKDICEMGDAWAELEILHLASRNYANGPQDDGTRGMPLNFLSTFAINLPRLRKLGVHVSTQEIPLVKPQPFPNLEVFCPGTSFLERSRDKVLEAFAFFSAILPKGAELLLCELDFPIDSDWMPSVFKRWSLYQSDMNLKTWGILNTLLSEGVTEEVLDELGTQESNVWDLSPNVGEWAHPGEDWDPSLIAW